jgi:hypothetical protein
MQHSNYHVDEIQLPSGTVLREFTAAGRVFAVAWSGPAIPNLRQALGSYFAAYAAGAEGSRAGRRHLAVQQDDFVLQSNGRMRAFSGRAYLPRALPVGVSLDELH